MPKYTFAPAPVLVESTGEFAIGATGVLRDGAGAVVPVYDLNGSPLPNILVGQKGAHQAFKADIPDGVLDFGSVLLPTSAVELRRAAVEALAVSKQALIEAQIARARVVAAGTNAATPRPTVVPLDAEVMWLSTERPTGMGPVDSWVQLATTASGGGTVAGPTTGTRPDLTKLYKAPQQIDSRLGTYPELQPIADQPQAKWINTQPDADNIPALATAAAGKTLVLCIYAIPGRDSGNYSAGGFPDRATYLAFIESIKKNLGSAPAFIIYEPDALGLTPGMTTANRAERIETLRLAVNILGTIPNAETYVDASMWIPIADQATMLKSVDVHLVTGFSLNISGHNLQSVCYKYGNDVQAALSGLGISGKKFVVDSGRNGVGPLTDADRPLADPWLNTGQAWCNPPKRRTGLTPGPVVDQPNCRGTLWVKNPGESDGSFPTLTDSNYFGESAPSAGAFWVPAARDLLGLSPQPGTASTTGTISDVKATFDVDFGPFTVRTAGPTIVGGRARIPSTVGVYENIATTSAYTLLGGMKTARLYPAAANGTTGEASTMMTVNSPTAGDRCMVRVDTAKNQILFARETGYYDPAGVVLTYDPTAHAWVRIRESSGTVYWDTSPDGTTWTNQKSAPTPAWATSTKDSSVQFVVYRDAGTNNYAEIDDVR